MRSADVTRMLIDLDREIDESGRDADDVLFAVEGREVPARTRFVMELPCAPSGALQELYEAGLRAREVVFGLVLVLRTPIARALVAVLRGGETLVVAHGEGEPAHLVARLPEQVGSHEDVIAGLARILTGEAIPAQRGFQDRSRIA